MKKIRLKECVVCKKPENVMFRARSKSKKEWSFYCESCLLVFKKECDDYQYGGTWKSKKKL